MTDRPTLAPHWRGYLLRFENPLQRITATGVSLRLLLLFVCLEVAIGPRMAGLDALGVTFVPQRWRIPILLVVALLGVRLFAKTRLVEIGLRPWSRWAATERSFGLQFFVLANIVFVLAFAPRLGRVFADPEMTARAIRGVPLLIAWGFYQEVIYRGILQTALTSRLGGTAGILLSNALFTFGPLHFYHFETAASPLTVFAAIFGVGLYFAVLFQRSGNLWIIGIVHGLADWYVLCGR